MAGGLGADLSGVKGYTVGLLFLAFVVISVVMEAALHQVSFHSYRHSPGLYHLYLKLKDEIMLLGILSLILELFMNGLNGLCVSGSFVLNSADDANSTPKTRRPSRRCEKHPDDAKNTPITRDGDAQNVGPTPAYTARTRDRSRWSTGPARCSSAV